MNDDDLVRAARGGDLDAFGALVRRHEGAVYAFVRSRVGDPAAAADIAQEVFIAAHRGLAKLEEGSRALGWLFGIARHKVGEHHRTAARRPPALAGADLDALPAPAAPDDPGALLEALTDGLPDEMRAVAILRFRDGLAYREIAAKLGMPDGTVATLLHRARERIAANQERLASRASPHAGSAGRGRPR